MDKYFFYKDNLLEYNDLLNVKCDVIFGMSYIFLVLVVLIVWNFCFFLLFFFVKNKNKVKI